jgi:hypothetical protein
MADTFGSLVDKLATCNQKMFMAQEDLYQVRKMTFEQFKETFCSSDEGINRIYSYFKKGMDLNLQRQAIILELDKKLVEIVNAAINGENLDNGSFVQDQHKTY